MKKLWMLVAVTGIAFSVTAQRGVKSYSSGIIKGPKVVTVVRPAFGLYNPRFGYGYSPFGYSPFAYSPFGYRPFGFGQAFYEPNTPLRQPSKIDLTIEQIKNDFGYQIATVRNNEALERSERREKIRGLKHDRDGAIINAKREYYDRKS